MQERQELCFAIVFCAVSYHRLNPSYIIHLWFDHQTLDGDQADQDWLEGMVLHDIQEETWENGDLMEQATNFAMMTDMMRLEIVHR